MKRILFILALLAPLILQGQNKQITVRSFQKADISDMRARTAPVLDRNQRLAALVEITLPVTDSTIRFAGIIGEPIQFAGSWMVHVVEGAESFTIYVPDCSPITFSFPEAPESGRVYEMKLGIEEMLKLRTMVAPFYSHTTSQSSYGVMLGLCKRHGGYIKAKTNFVFGLNPTSECNEEGIIDGVKAWFTGESASSRYSFTAGYMAMLFQTRKNMALYAYLGGGYGARTLAWQAYGQDGGYEFAKVTSHSYQGWEAETGIVFRMGGFALMGSVQTNQFKHVEVNVGIGFML